METNAVTIKTNDLDLVGSTQSIDFASSLADYPWVASLSPFRLVIEYAECELGKISPEIILDVTHTIGQAESVLQLPPFMPGNP